MSDTVEYTHEELAAMTIGAYYKVVALQQAVIDSMDSLLSEIADSQEPLSHDHAKKLSAAFRSRLSKTSHDHFLSLLADDLKVSASLDQGLKDDLLL